MTNKEKLKDGERDVLMAVLSNLISDYKKAAAMSDSAVWTTKAKLIGDIQQKLIRILTPDQPELPSVEEQRNVIINHSHFTVPTINEIQTLNNNGYYIVKLK